MELRSVLGSYCTLLCGRIDVLAFKCWFSGTKKWVQTLAVSYYLPSHSLYVLIGDDK